MWVVVPANSLATSAFFLAMHTLFVAAVAANAASAVASSFFLVQRAQRLSTKGEILIFDNNGLDPGVCVEVDLAR